MGSESEGPGGYAGPFSAAEVASAYRIMLFEKASQFVASLVQLTGTDINEASAGVVSAHRMVMLALGAGIADNSKFPKTEEEFVKMCFEGLKSLNEIVSYSMNDISKRNGFGKRYMVQVIEMDDKAGSKD